MWFVYVLALVCCACVCVIKKSSITCDSASVCGLISTYRYRTAGKLYSQDNRSGASTYYVGEFTNGKPHGKGKTVFIQHNTIPRKHKDTLPSSVFSWTGKEKLSQLGNIHEGIYENGQYHGKGRIAFLSGDIYEGDFVNGEIQGKKRGYKTV